VILFSLLFNSACPKKVEKTFRKASEASANLSIYGEKLIQANIDAFKAKEISFETFELLNELTRKFVEGVKIYEKALDEAEKLIKENGGQAPVGTLERLSKIFSAEVADKFTAILAKFKLISGEQSEAIKTAVAGINLAILAIREAFAGTRDIQGGFNYEMV